jgi:hypothetical protein
MGVSFFCFTRKIFLFRTIQKHMKALILSSICSVVAISTLSPNLTENQVIFFTVVTWVSFFMVFWIWNPKVKLPDIKIARKPRAAPPKKANKRDPKDDTMSNRNLSSQAQQMAQYKRWCVQVVGNIIITEKLNVGLSRTLVGPLTITFVLKLLNPNKTELDKLLSLSSVFAQGLQLEAVRLANSGNGILMEIPSPIANTPNATDLTEHTRGPNLCIGIDTFNDSVFVSLKQHGAIGWIGPSRRGKTQAIKSCVYNLLATNPNKIRFVIFAQKVKDWAVFVDVAGCEGVFNDASDIETVFQNLDEELNIRAANGQVCPTLVVCDDLVNLLNLVPSITDKLENLASMGAGVGFHLLFGTQMAGSKKGSGGMAVESNLTARILYKPASNATGARNAGTKNTQLDMLSENKGDALAVIDGVTTRIATSFINDETINLLPKSSKVAAVQGGTADESLPVQLVQPVDRSSVAPLDTGGTSAVPVQKEPSSSSNGAQKNGLRGDGTDRYKLKAQPPTPLERKYLRKLFEEVKSKNAVLKIAYGGVVNESGKTPKTLKWLNEALEEKDAGSEDEQHTIDTETFDVTELLQQANWDQTVNNLRSQRIAKSS